MTTNNSPQGLGRTDDIRDHRKKLFCIHYIAADADRNDALGDAVLLATLELKLLSERAIHGRVVAKLDGVARDAQRVTIATAAH